MGSRADAATLAHLRELEEALEEAAEARRNIESARREAEEGRAKAVQAFEDSELARATAVSGLEDMKRAFAESQRLREVAEKAYDDALQEKQAALRAKERAEGDLHAVGLALRKAETERDGAFNGAEQARLSLSRVRDELAAERKEARERREEVAAKAVVIQTLQGTIAGLKIAATEERDRLDTLQERYNGVFGALADVCELLGLREPDDGFDFAVLRPSISAALRAESEVALFKGLRRVFALLRSHYLGVELETVMGGFVEDNPAAARRLEDEVEPLARRVAKEFAAIFFPGPATSPEE